MANDPILSGYPDASTTGVPAGVTLTAYTGPMEITTPGTVIDGKVIRGTLRVMASDVTIKNSLIQNIGVWGIDGDGAARLTVQDSDIIGNGRDTNAGILGSGTFLRNDIQNAENGIVLLSGASTVRGNYIHDLQGGPSAHYDGISVQGGQNGVLIEHNTVLSRDTSDIFIKSDFGAINNVVVTDNYLAGSAGYVIYSMVGNSGAPVTNITITDNYVEKGFYGYYSIERGTAVVSGNIEFGSGSVPTAGPVSVPMATALSTQVDKYDQYSWSSIVTTSDLTGRVESVAYSLDDNSHVVYQYDLTNGASWSRITTNIDSASRTSQIVYDMRDGTHVLYQYDTPGISPWSQIMIVCDPAWRQSQIVYDLRDGSHALYQYDTVGKSPWLRITTKLDATWRASEVLYDMKDATHTLYQYDFGSTNTWARITTEFDALWHTQKAVYDNDDGRHTVYSFDPASGNTVSAQLFDSGWSLLI